MSNEISMYVIIKLGIEKVKKDKFFFREILFEFAFVI